MATKNLSNTKVKFGKGGKEKERERIAVKKRTKKPGKTLLSDAELDANRPFYCTCCGSKYTQKASNFFKSYSPLFASNDGYLPVCKECVEKYYENLVSFFNGNEERAIERLCQLFDWYYRPDASEVSIGMKSTRVESYLATIVLKQYKSRGTDFLQTIRDVTENGPMITGTLQQAPNEKNGDDEFASDYLPTMEVVKRWGKGMHAEDYEYLEEQYADWLDKVKIETKSQDELIKAICIAQLNVRNAQRQGGKVAEAMKALTDLMANCNLTPRQASDSASANINQSSLGQLIKRIEDEEPIPEPTDEFKDPDRIRHYITTFFYGHLARALHIKNDYQKAYDEEMAKYTVVPPENDDGVEAISDMFGSGDESDEGDGIQ